MADDDLLTDERAQRAFESAFEQRGRGFEPIVPDPTRIGQRSRRAALRRAGLVVAAAVVVSGTTAGVTWWTGSASGDLGHPAASARMHTGSPIDGSSIDAQNRQREQAAEREATRVLEAMPEPRGAQRVQAGDVPPLAKLTSFLMGQDKSVRRSGFWLVPGQAESLARWYARNPPSGMVTEGGQNGIGGSRNPDGSWSQQLTYDPERSQHLHSAALVQLTPVDHRVGVRITIFTTWTPARPPLSFAPHDVTAVRIAVVGNGHDKVVTIADAATVARLVRAYNGLPGTHALPISCPYTPNRTVYRLTFVSQTREVSASFLSGSCNFAWYVQNDGKPLEPALGNTGRLLDLITLLTLRTGLLMTPGGR